MFDKGGKRQVWLLALTVLALTAAILACGESASSEPTATPCPTHTPHATYTPLPEVTDTLKPTNTPTRTPRPTDTLTPTPEFERTETQVVEMVGGDTITAGIGGEFHSTLTTSTVGTRLPRIQCAQGYVATVYGEGLSSPDGLAFSPAGVLHVAEERAGRVSQIGPTGDITPVITGLTDPEGIAFDKTGNLYVVEDTQVGRLVKRTPNGLTTTLATDLEGPEGVVWALGGTLHVTESNIEFVTSPADVRTRIAIVSSSGVVSRVITSTPTISGTDVSLWSYAGLTIGLDGLLYVSNELSGREETIVVIPGVLTFTLSTTDSIFIVNPLTGDRTLFASNLVSPEGSRFSANGEFPLYVAEEDIGNGAGRLSRVESDGSHTPLCTGFFSIEDVTMNRKGWLYVSEDASGLVILIKQ